MTAPTLQEPSLVWGELEFIGPNEIPETPFEVEAVANGWTFGDPEPVIETMPSLLIDGALAAVTRWENREVVIHLRVSANDGDALAEGEAMLFQQKSLDQPPPLVWSSPVGLSAPCVFDVVVADLRREYGDGWDLEEILRGYRYYVLTLTCLPFARAVESTVVPALAPPATSPTTVTIDDCTSAAGWTVDATDPGATGPTVVSGAVTAEGDINSGADFLKLVRAGAVAMGATPYLMVDVDLEGYPAFGIGWRIDVDGVTHSPVTVVDLGHATFQVYFDLTGESFTTLAIYYDYGPGTITGGVFSVMNVARTDLLNIAGTSRQQSRTFEILGSAPTQGAIRLFDANPAELGTDILVATSRSSVQNLRPWIDSASGDVPFADAVSGFANLLDTPIVLLVPASLLPAGAYALLARIGCITPGTLTWQARMTTLAGADTVGSDVVLSGEVEIPDTGVGVFEVMNIAALILPVIEVEGDDYAVEITLTGTVDMGFDDGWPLPLDDGAVTWIKDTDGLTNIEIRSPELGAARPSVWGGTGAAGESMTCIDRKCESFGSHRLEPGDNRIYTVATISLEAQCEVEYFQRGPWHVRGEETA